MKVGAVPKLYFTFPCSAIEKIQDLYSFHYKLVIFVNKRKKTWHVQ
jgi:hypothetical protein